MKNLIIGLLIGLVVSGLACWAKENVIANPIIKLSRGVYDLYTTKVTAPEGAYRVFIVDSSTGSSVTAIKIK